MKVIVNRGKEGSIEISDGYENNVELIFRQREDDEATAVELYRETLSESEAVQMLQGLKAILNCRAVTGS